MTGINDIDEHNENPAVAGGPAAALDTEAGNKRVTCAISGKGVARRKTQQLGSLRPSLVDRIRAEHPGIALEDLIGVTEIGKFRSRYVEEMLTAERGELSDLDRRVAESMERDRKSVV